MIAGGPRARATSTVGTRADITSPVERKKDDSEESYEV